jgi:hypothetical protein
VSSLIVGHAIVALVSFAGGVGLWCLLTADRRNPVDNDWPGDWRFCAWLAGMAGMAAVWMWLRWTDN